MSARLSKFTRLSSHCQALFKFASRPLNSLLAGVPRLRSQPAHRMNVPLRVVALRKISKSDQQTTPEPLGLTGDKSPGSCNGLFSEGFPTGVQGLLPHLTQRTIFPLPSSGRLKATGRIHCSNCNFQRVAQPLFIRKPRPLSGFAVCDFQRVAQPLSVCKCFPMFRLAVLAASKE